MNLRKNLLDEGIGVKLKVNELFIVRDGFYPIVGFKL